ncbi:hypothetical protein [Cellulomonas sp. ATA003]|uniref:hypothetical protein n=1 Tax=Cellulomonas sp. ATA003 TaxID=3073064 RepID=UPI0028734404|nr:hypothetical protein [Cellulomonas sp. ATA003]WNB85196.1 hypothetical protein REH70_16395 [Cellulomonas sp. ATA003]
MLRDGRYLTYFASSGGPGIAARFFAMDLTGATVAEVTLPTGTDVLTVAYSPASRTVFLAANTASSGYLYEWDGTALRSVGSITGQLIERVAAAPDGAVYLGTYAPSNGRLHVYSGGRITDLGQPMPGESYVRSLVVDERSVWMSNYRGGAATLVRKDRATGAVTVIPTPAAFRAEWAAMDMSLAGKHLFLRTVNRPLLFAYNTVTGVFDTFDDQVARTSSSTQANVVPYIDGISPYGISPLFEGRYVYFQRSGAGIMRIDVTAGLKTVRVDKWNPADNPVSWPGASVAGPVSYAWLDGVAGRRGHSLVTTTITGKVLVNGPAQAGPTTFSLAAQDPPSTILSLGTDAAGTVFSGGFDLPSGVGKVDPRTGATTLLAGPQIEGFGRFGDAVVMGGYTGNASAAAPLYVYSGSGEPQLRTHINHGQERPVAMVQVGSRMAIGTVPVKNTLGGALTLWDPATNALTVKRNIVPDHSVISLAARGGLVVGGTSNAGGTGSVPTATSGQIFTYDTATGAVKTFTPPRAVTATYSWVAAITPDPVTDGRFWAISTGYVIQFEVDASGDIRLTRNLGAFPGTSSPTGKELGIEFVHGTMFATVGQELAAINTVTGERTVVAPKTSVGPVVGLVRTGADTLVYARGARLYRYTVEDAAVLSDPCAVVAPEPTNIAVDGYNEPNRDLAVEGTGTPGSLVTMVNGTRTRTATVREDGRWTMNPLWFGWWTGSTTFTASVPGCPDVSRDVWATFATRPASHVPALVTSHTSTQFYPAGSATFAGKGTPGAEITLQVGSQTRTAVVGSTGRWTMRAISVTAAPVTVTFRSTVPEHPDRESTVDVHFGDAPTTLVGPVLTSHSASSVARTGEVVFSGRATPSSKISVQVEGRTVQAFVRSNGRWDVPAVPVGAGVKDVVLTSSSPGIASVAARSAITFG